MFGFFCCFLPSFVFAFGTFNELNDQQKSMLEPIQGTNNYRMHGRKGKDEKSWFGDRERGNIFCLRKGRCELLKHKTCFGSVLPYNYSSVLLTDSYSQEQTRERLYAYHAIKHVPKCWAVIQPFLCAVFLPKCDEIDGEQYVYLPSLEMCRKTQEPCRILYDTPYFPDFLKCNETLFPSKCNNDVREMKFNSTGQCLKPLVSTDNPASYYKDIDGCGVQCKDPHFTDYEHDQIHKLVSWGASVCLVLNLFTIATYWLDWEISKKFPAVVLLYISICYSLVCLGWLMQFLIDRDMIVCKPDGTLRQSEPSGNAMLCNIVFFLVYYFIIAAMNWFVIFNYALYQMIFKAIGNCLIFFTNTFFKQILIYAGKLQEKSKKTSHFHLIAWSIPSILWITIMGLGEVDGDSVTGICFVGHVNHVMRGIFLLVPVFLTLVVGGFFLAKGTCLMTKQKILSRYTVEPDKRKKLQRAIVRMLVCNFLIFVFIVITFLCHFIEFTNSTKWDSSLREYIICLISSTYTDSPMTCKMNHRPSVSYAQLHLLVFFGSGIVMCSWIWTKSTIDSWKRKFGCGSTDQPKQVPKHKLIANLFAKKDTLKEEGHLSINFDNHEYTDPAGLNFDVNSAKGSYNFSETWANNLPQLIKRRGAITYAETSTSQEPRKNSVDSEYSYSIRQVSIESRRNSIDSQVSVNIARVKIEKKTKITHRNRDGKKQGRTSKKSNCRNNYRKDSTTSESQSFIAQSTVTQQRRTAIGTIDPNLLMKELFPTRVTLTSEDDNISDVAQNLQLPAIMGNFENDTRAIELSDLKRSTEGHGRGNKNTRKKESQALLLPSTHNKNITKTNSYSQTSSDSDSDDSISSVGSENAAPLDLQSSAFSGVSTTKTGSRNSKRSCDVGIQANAHEIATQTFSSFEFNPESSVLNEFHTLLNNKRLEKNLSMRKREELSETEKLKLLLLPSK